MRTLPIRRRVRRLIPLVLAAGWLPLVTGCSIPFLAARKDPFYAVVLEKDRNQPFALFAQGDMLLEQKRFDEAAPYFARLTRVQPQHAGAWLKLGRCQLELRQYARAEASYAKARALRDTAEAHLGFALANMMQGKVAQAKKEAEAMRTALEESPELFNLYGDIGIIEGKPEEALGFYEQSLRLQLEQPTIQERYRDLQAFLETR
jgi:tetratricopeptide (TPR) repeat protein